MFVRATSPGLNPITGISPRPTPHGVHLSLDDDFALPAAEHYQALSSRNLFVNIVMTITGTTILGVSSQMKRGGLFLAPLVACMVAMIITEMTRLTSITVDQMQVDMGLNVRAYQDFVAGALGRWGRLLSSVTCTGDLLCAICIGNIVAASNFQFLVPIRTPWPQGDIGPEEGGRKWWALILSLTTLIYSFYDLGPLARFASKAGPVVGCINIFLALAGSVLAGSDSGEFPLDCRDSHDQQYWSLVPSAGGGAFLSFAGVLSYFFYCFAMVVTVPSLKSEMSQPKELPRVAGDAYDACVVIFLLVMGAAYWAFGNLGPDNLVQGMRIDRPAGWWAMSRPWETGRGAMVGSALSALTTTIMLLIDCTYVPCAVIAVEGTAPEFFKQSRCARVAARLGVVFMRLLVSTQVHSFVALSSLSSALFCMSNNVLLPILAFYLVGAQKVSRLRKLMHAVIFALGCFVVAFGTYNAFRDILWPPALQVEAVGIFPRSGVSPTCKADYREATFIAQDGR